MAGLLAHLRATIDPRPRDFTLVWYAARAVLHGQDPYALVGPGRPFEYSAGLFYPLPGIFAAVPFTPLPAAAANGLFMVIGGAVLAWSLMEHGYGPLIGFFSASLYFTAEVVQWTPLFAGSFTLPALGMVYAIKPQTGLAFFLANPSRWAVIGAVVLTALAFAVQPHWIASWRGGLADAHLMRQGHGLAYLPPVLLPGGVLVLTALSRWRRPEARLLVALVCLPQAFLLYETVPLLLIPRSWKEAAFLCACSWFVLWSVGRAAHFSYFPDFQEATGRAYTLFMYLPATAMILRRPNEGRTPAWIERRLDSWPAWIRGRVASDA